jgi:hypothetical protein
MVLSKRFVRETVGKAVSTFCVLLGLLIPAAAADSAASTVPAPVTELSNADTAALLAQARDALAKLEAPPAGDGPEQPKIYFDTAADCFTSLLQLHGCEWAAAELRTLYARPDAPQLRIGNSPDGRVQLRVEPLELQNPVFNDYTVLLCTFTSQTARDVVHETSAQLELTLPDGTWAGPHLITPEHPLWAHLKRLSGQFSAPPALPSGSAVAFKQAYAIPRARLPLNTCELSLEWGGYRFDLPRWVETPAGADNGKVPGRH